jgi:hypothetical protein
MHQVRLGSVLGPVWLTISGLLIQRPNDVSVVKRAVTFSHNFSVTNLRQLLSIYYGCFLAAIFATGLSLNQLRVPGSPPLPTQSLRLHLSAYFASSAAPKHSFLRSDPADERKFKPKACNDSHFCRNVSEIY